MIFDSIASLSKRLTGNNFKSQPLEEKNYVSH
jgi:hypothetical protein